MGAGWQDRLLLVWPIRRLCCCPARLPTGPSLSLPLLHQEDAEPESLATCTVARREVCLFCHVSCAISFLSVLFIIQPMAKEAG